jgi:hypothetical protein
MPIEPPEDLELELVESTDDGVLRSVLRPSPSTGPSRNPVVDPRDLAFVGELWHWRGPAPYHFISVPREAADAIRAVAAEVTYGWGMIPVTVRVGRSEWSTALWPKDGGYVVPIKDRFREAERWTLGDTVSVRLAVRTGSA